MSNYIFILNAPSSGGKDSIYNIINSLLPCDNIKFAQPCKTAFEQWLGLEPGDLNEQYIKSQLIVNPITGITEKCTYGEILGNAYWAWDDIYPWLTVGYVWRKIINNTNNLVFTDIRKNTEIEAVNKYIEITKPTAVVLIDIVGRGEYKAVDGNVDYSNLYTTDFYLISNYEDTTKGMLTEDVRYILKQCKAI